MSRQRRFLVLGLLGFLAVVALAVIWVLPRWIARHPPELVTAQPAVPPPAASADAVRQARAKRAAEALLSQVLREQAQLMDGGVERWAKEDFAAALTRLAEGDVAFQDARYEAALSAYRAVADQFAALRASRPRRLAAALRAGDEAFARPDAAAAAEQYRIALALEPGNAPARRGLKRALNLDAVLAHMKEGAARREAGDWAAARQAFAAAATLDPEYEPAARALEQVEKKLAGIRFARHLSAFYKALSAGDFAAAGQWLAKAGGVRPGADELAIARRQLDAAERRAKLERLRAQAARQVAAEQWAAALESYDQALKIDPHVAFAQHGREQGRPRAGLDAALERFLSQPERLYSPGPLDNARRLLTTARAVAKPGPRLAGQIEQLARLIRQAVTPLPVTLVSDGATAVTVYRVGALGRFVTRRLELVPGDYVAVGSRQGYRDVRRRFSLRPGRQMAPVTIICEERL